MKRILPKLHPSHILFILFLVGGVIFPAQSVQAMQSLTSWFATNMGWLVMLACSFFVVFALYLSFSRYGQIKLGRDDEMPQFSLPSWLAMLFAAGIGSGLVFYGAAEPLLHFQNPPPSAGLITQEAAIARRAMAITYFHWGIHAWAVYAMAALAIAYFTFRVKTPMLPSAPITHFMATKWVRPARRIIDSVAVLGVVFGLVSSIGQALLQLSEGVQNELLPNSNLLTLQLSILIAMFVCYTLSASTGIGKGIKLLSDINMSMAGLVLLFVLVLGPTLFILNSFVTALGDYFDRFSVLSFNLRPFSDAEGWTGAWSITYFLWWISWGPFVGVFIARISRGRTIREFLLGAVLLPSFFSFLWFAVMGGSALHLELFDAPGFAADSSVPGIIFRMLEHFPLHHIVPLFVLALLFVFLVTSADSGTYVLGMFTSEGNLNPPVWERLFWGAIVALVATGAMLTGKGTSFMRAFAVIGAVPYLFVMLWQCWCLHKKLKQEEL